jgi:hypothetical protein
MSAKTAIQDFKYGHECWDQRKRPASPALRRELLRMAVERRYAEYTRMDGSRLTAEDRAEIRKANREIHQMARRIFLEADAQVEARYWQLLGEFGIYGNGGLQ